MAVHFNFTVQEIIEQGRVTRQQIDEFKSWLATRTNDYPVLSEEQMVLFLLSCDCDQEASKATVKAHYASKLNVNEFFTDRDVDREELQQQLTVVEFATMPNRTPTGAAILFFKIKKSAYYDFHLVTCIKLWFMTIDCILHEKDPPTGLIIIIDMENLSLWHLTRFRLDATKKFFYYLQEGLVLKLQQIECLQTVYFIDKFLTLIKPFMSKKIYDMIRFHFKDMDLNEFHKLVPADCLPEELGGSLGPLEVLVERTVEKLRELKPIFLDEEKQLRRFKEKLLTK